MSGKNERISVLCVSLLALAVGFIVIRFALFGLHGMKQWPMLLFCAAAVVCAAGALVKAYFTACITSAGYIVGFAVALSLAKTTVDPVMGAVNNLWFIWLIVLLICIIMGIATDIYISLNRKKRR